MICRNPTGKSISLLTSHFSMHSTNSAEKTSANKDLLHKIYQLDFRLDKVTNGAKFSIFLKVWFLL